MLLLPPRPPETPLPKLLPQFDTTSLCVQPLTFPGLRGLGRRDEEEPPPPVGQDKIYKVNLCIADPGWGDFDLEILPILPSFFYYDLAQVLRTLFQRRVVQAAE